MSLATPQRVARSGNANRAKRLHRHHGSTTGRERRYQVDQAQLARAVAQLASVGASWDARLQRIKRIAEAIQRERDADRDD